MPRNRTVSRPPRHRLYRADCRLSAGHDHLLLHPVEGRAIEARIVGGRIGGTRIHGYRARRLHEIGQQAGEHSAAEKRRATIDVQFGRGVLWVVRTIIELHSSGSLTFALTAHSAVSWN